MASVFPNPVKAGLYKFLDRLLSPWVDGLTRNSLEEVSLLQGRLSLTNLKLKADALQQLGMPFQVSDGQLDRLDVHIPWSAGLVYAFSVTADPAAISMKPITVAISSIRLSVKPLESFNVSYDPAKELEERIRKKIGSIDAAFRARLALQAKRYLAADAAAGSNTIQDRVMAVAFRVLTVSIQRVHAQYVDSLSDPGRPLLIGVLLDQLRYGPCTDACCTAATVHVGDTGATAAERSGAFRGSGVDGGSDEADEAEGGDDAVVPPTPSTLRFQHHVLRMDGLHVYLDAHRPTGQAAAAHSHAAVGASGSQAAAARLTSPAPAATPVPASVADALSPGPPPPSRRTLRRMSSTAAMFTPPTASQADGGSQTPAASALSPTGGDPLQSPSRGLRRRFSESQLLQPMRPFPVDDINHAASGGPASLGGGGGPSLLPGGAGSNSNKSAASSGLTPRMLELCMWARLDPFNLSFLLSDASATVLLTKNLLTHVASAQDPPDRVVSVHMEQLRLRLQEAQLAHLRVVLSYRSHVKRYARYRAISRPERAHEAMLSPIERAQLAAWLHHRRLIALVADVSARSSGARQRRRSSMQRQGQHASADSGDEGSVRAESTTSTIDIDAQLEVAEGVEGYGGEVGEEAGHVQADDGTTPSSTAAAPASDSDDALRLLMRQMPADPYATLPAATVRDISQRAREWWAFAIAAVRYDIRSARGTIASIPDAVKKASARQRYVRLCRKAWPALCGALLVPTVTLPGFSVLCASLPPAQSMRDLGIATSTSSSAVAHRPSVEWVMDVSEETIEAHQVAIEWVDSSAGAGGGGAAPTAGGAGGDLSAAAAAGLRDTSAGLSADVALKRLRALEAALPEQDILTYRTLAETELRLEYITQLQLERQARAREFAAETTRKKRRAVASKLLNTLATSVMQQSGLQVINPLGPLSSHESMGAASAAEAMAAFLQARNAYSVALRIDTLQEGTEAHWSRAAPAVDALMTVGLKQQGVVARLLEARIAELLQAAATSQQVTTSDTEDASTPAVIDADHHESGDGSATASQPLLTAAEQSAGAGADAAADSVAAVGEKKPEKKGMMKGLRRLFSPLRRDKGDGTGASSGASRSDPIAKAAQQHSEAGGAGTGAATAATAGAALERIDDHEFWPLDGLLCVPPAVGLAVMLGMHPHAAPVGSDAPAAVSRDASHPDSERPHDAGEQPVQPNGVAGALVIHSYPSAQGCDGRTYIMGWIQGVLAASCSPSEPSLWRRIVRLTGAAATGDGQAVIQNNNTAAAALYGTACFSSSLSSQDRQHITDHVRYVAAVEADSGLPPGYCSDRMDFHLGAVHMELCPERSHRALLTLRLSGLSITGKRCVGPHITADVSVRQLEITAAGTSCLPVQLDLSAINTPDAVRLAVTAAYEPAATLAQRLVQLPARPLLAVKAAPLLLPAIADGDGDGEGEGHSVVPDATPAWLTPPGISTQLPMVVDGVSTSMLLLEGCPAPGVLLKDGEALRQLELWLPNFDSAAASPAVVATWIALWQACDEYRSATGGVGSSGAISPRLRSLQRAAAIVRAWLDAGSATAAANAATTAALMSLGADTTVMSSPTQARRPKHKKSVPWIDAAAAMGPTLPAWCPLSLPVARGMLRAYAEAQATLTADARALLTTLLPDALDEALEQVQRALADGPLRQYVWERWCPLHGAFRSSCSSLRRTCPTPLEVLAAAVSTASTSAASHARGAYAHHHCVRLHVVHSLANNDSVLGVDPTDTDTTNGATSDGLPGGMGESWCRSPLTVFHPSAISWAGSSRTATDSGGGGRCGLHAATPAQSNASTIDGAQMPLDTFSLLAALPLSCIMQRGVGGSSGVGGVEQLPRFRDATAAMMALADPTAPTPGARTGSWVLASVDMDPQQFQLVVRVPETRAVVLSLPLIRGATAVPAAQLLGSHAAEAGLADEEAATIELLQTAGLAVTSPASPLPLYLLCQGLAVRDTLLKVMNTALEFVNREQSQAVTTSSTSTASSTIGSQLQLSIGTLNCSITPLLADELLRLVRRTGSAFGITKRSLMQQAADERQQLQAHIVAIMTPTIKIKRAIYRVFNGGLGGAQWTDTSYTQDCLAAAADLRRRRMPLLPAPAAPSSHPKDTVTGFGLSSQSPAATAHDRDDGSVAEAEAEDAGPLPRATSGRSLLPPPPPERVPTTALKPRKQHHISCRLGGIQLHMPMLLDAAAYGAPLPSRSTALLLLPAAVRDASAAVPPMLQISIGTVAIQTSSMAQFRKGCCAEDNAEACTAVTGIGPQQMSAYQPVRALVESISCAVVPATMDHVQPGKYDIFSLGPSAVYHVTSKSTSEVVTVHAPPAAVSLVSLGQVRLRAPQQALTLLTLMQAGWMMVTSTPSKPAAAQGKPAAPAAPAAAAGSAPEEAAASRPTVALLACTGVSLSLLKAGRDVPLIDASITGVKLRAYQSYVPYASLEVACELQSALVTATRPGGGVCTVALEPSLQVNDVTSLHKERSMQPAVHIALEQGQQGSDTSSSSGAGAMRDITVSIHCVQMAVELATAFATQQAITATAKALQDTSVALKPGPVRLTVTRVDDGAPPRSGAGNEAGATGVPGEPARVRSKSRRTQSHSDIFPFHVTPQAWAYASLPAARVASMPGVIPAGFPLYPATLATMAAGIDGQQAPPPPTGAAASTGSGADESAGGAAHAQLMRKVHTDIAPQRTRLAALLRLCGFGASVLADEAPAVQLRISARITTTSCQVTDHTEEGGSMPLVHVLVRGVQCSHIRSAAVATVDAATADAAGAIAVNAARIEQLRATLQLATALTTGGYSWSGNNGGIAVAEMESVRVISANCSSGAISISPRDLTTIDEGEDDDDDAALPPDQQVTDVATSLSTAAAAAPSTTWTQGWLLRVSVHAEPDPRSLPGWAQRKYYPQWQPGNARNAHLVRELLLCESLLVPEQAAPAAAPAVSSRKSRLGPLPPAPPPSSASAPVPNCLPTAQQLDEYMLCSLEAHSTTMVRATVVPCAFELYSTAKLPGSAPAAAAGGSAGAAAATVPGSSRGMPSPPQRHGHDAHHVHPPQPPNGINHVRLGGLSLNADPLVLMSVLQWQRGLMDAVAAAQGPSGSDKNAATTTTAAAHSNAAAGPGHGQHPQPTVQPSPRWVHTGASVSQAVVTLYGLANGVHPPPPPSTPGASAETQSASPEGDGILVPLGITFPHTDLLLSRLFAAYDTSQDTTATGVAATVLGLRAVALTMHDAAPTSAQILGELDVCREVDKSWLHIAVLQRLQEEQVGGFLSATGGAALWRDRIQLLVEYKQQLLQEQRLRLQRFSGEQVRYAARRAIRSRAGSRSVLSSSAMGLEDSGAGGGGGASSLEQALAEELWRPLRDDAHPWRTLLVPSFNLIPGWSSAADAGGGGGGGGGGDLQGLDGAASIAGGRATGIPGMPAARQPFGAATVRGGAGSVHTGLPPGAGGGGSVAGKSRATMAGRSVAGSKLRGSGAQDAATVLTATGITDGQSGAVHSALGAVPAWFLLRVGARTLMHSAFLSRLLALAAAGLRGPSTVTEADSSSEGGSDGGAGGEGRGHSGRATGASSGIKRSGSRSKLRNTVGGAALPPTAASGAAAHKHVRSATIASPPLNAGIRGLLSPRTRAAMLEGGGVRALALRDGGGGAEGTPVAIRRSIVPVRPAEAVTHALAIQAPAADAVSVGGAADVVTPFTGVELSDTEAEAGSAEAATSAAATFTGRRSESAADAAHDEGSFQDGAVPPQMASPDPAVRGPRAAAAQQARARQRHSTSTTELPDGRMGGAAASPGSAEVTALLQDLSAPAMLSLAMTYPIKRLPRSPDGAAADREAAKQRAANMRRFAERVSAAEQDGEPVPTPAPIPVDMSLASHTRVWLRRATFVYFKRWLDETKAMTNVLKAAMEGEGVWPASFVPRAAAFDHMATELSDIRLVMPHNSGAPDRALTLHLRSATTSNQLVLLPLPPAAAQAALSSVPMLPDGSLLSSVPVERTLLDAVGVDAGVAESLARGWPVTGRDLPVPTPLSPPVYALPQPGMSFQAASLSLSILVDMSEAGPYFSALAYAAASAASAAADRSTAGPGAADATLQPDNVPTVAAQVPTSLPLARVTQVLRGGEVSICLDAPTGAAFRLACPMTFGADLTISASLDAALDMEQLTQLQDIQKSNAKEGGSLMHLPAELSVEASMRTHIMAPALRVQSAETMLPGALPRFRARPYLLAVASADDDGGLALDAAAVALATPSHVAAAAAAPLSARAAAAAAPVHSLPSVPPSPSSMIPLTHTLPVHALSTPLSKLSLLDAMSVAGQLAGLELVRGSSSSQMQASQPTRQRGSDSAKTAKTSISTTDRWEACIDAAVQAEGREAVLRRIEAAAGAVPLGMPTATAAQVLMLLCKAATRVAQQTVGASAGGAGDAHRASAPAAVDATVQQLLVENSDMMLQLLQAKTEEVEALSAHTRQLEAQLHQAVVNAVVLPPAASTPTAPTLRHRSGTPSAAAAAATVPSPLGATGIQLPPLVSKPAAAVANMRWRTQRLWILLAAAALLLLLAVAGLQWLPAGALATAAGWRRQQAPIAGEPTVATGMDIGTSLASSGGTISTPTEEAEQTVRDDDAL